MRGKINCKGYCFGHPLLGAACRGPSRAHELISERVLRTKRGISRTQPVREYSQRSLVAFWIAMLMVAMRCYPWIYPAGSTLYPAQGPRLKSLSNLEIRTIVDASKHLPHRMNIVRSFVRIAFRGLNDLSLLMRKVCQAWAVGNPSLVQLAKDESSVDRQYNQNCLK